MKKLIILSLVSLTFLAASCVEEIPMSFDSSYTRLVVEGAITTDTMAHIVKLTKSGPVINNKPYEPVENAVLSISDGTNVINLTEDPDNSGVYKTDPTAYGVPGNTYTLTINNVDIDGDGVLETYTAQSELRKENPIDSINVVYDGSNPDFAGWMIKLYGKEIGGDRNFYLMKAYINNHLVTDSTHEYRYVSDNTGFNGKYFDGFAVYMFDKKKKDEQVKDGDTITLEMNGIDQGYFSFINDFVQEYYPKVPIFSGPSADISTNVIPSEKAVGYFAAYSVQKSSRRYFVKK